MGHAHSVYDTDRHFSIDPITRVITNEFSTKNTVVQNDHNSERFTFELPRYVEGHDMSICDRVEVHYINISSATREENSGVYEVNDLQISPEDNSVVICSWLLSNNATKHEGITSFLLRFACTTDGELDYVWNTAIYSEINVSKGINNSGIVIEDYADILAQWHQDLFETGGNAVVNIKDAESKAIEALKNAAAAKEQEVLDNIPDDYQTLDANVTEYKSKVDGLANAIKGKLKGAVVRADDVSPVEHGVCVCVCSKNLIPYPYYYDSQTKNGVEMTVSEDGAITFNGTALADGSFRLIQDSHISVNGKYTLSGCNGGSNATYYLQPFIDGRGVSALLDGNKVYEWDGELTSLVFFFKSGTVFENVQFKFQLEKGSAPTEYTPYVDPASVKVTRHGKNLADISAVFTDAQKQVINNSDGTITVNTTATSSGVPMEGITLKHLAPHLKNGEIYTLSANSTGEEKKIWLQESNYTWNFGTSAVITVEMLDSHIFVYASGNSTTAIISNFQIEVGSTATGYEPYNSTTYTPTTDGTILDITSLSPTMTLLTDTPGAIVECEYNRDTNAVIADLYNKLADLSATT